MYEVSRDVGESVLIPIQTYSFTTGLRADAEGLPTYDIYEDATLTPIAEDVAFVKITGKVGRYVKLLTLTSGVYARNKSYTVWATATVGDKTDSWRVMQIKVDRVTPRMVGTKHYGLSAQEFGANYIIVAEGTILREGDIIYVPPGPANGDQQREIMSIDSGNPLKGIVDPWTGIPGLPAVYDHSYGVTVSGVEPPKGDLVDAAKDAIKQPILDAIAAIAGADATAILNVLQGPDTLLSLINARLPETPAVAGGAMTLSTAAIDAIHDDVLESGVTMRQAMRLILGAAAGLTNGFVPGAPGTGHFRDHANTKNRISVNYDANGNRTSLTFDLT